jgi:hypothetical protein
MPNVEKDHEKGATHYACKFMMNRDGGNARCCGCMGHDYEGEKKYQDKMMRADRTK